MTKPTNKGLIDMTTNRKDAEPRQREHWIRLALEQARLVVCHLENEVPNRKFVCAHALTLMQLAGCDESPCRERPWREDEAWVA